MSTIELRRKVKRTVDELSAEKLTAADRLLRRLLKIPGFLESFQRGLKDAAAGRLTPVNRLRRKR